MLLALSIGPPGEAFPRPPTHLENVSESPSLAHEAIAQLHPRYSSCHHPVTQRRRRAIRPYPSPLPLPPWRRPHASGRCDWKRPRSAWQSRHRRAPARPPVPCGRVTMRGWLKNPHVTAAPSKPPGPSVPRCQPPRRPFVAAATLLPAETRGESPDRSAVRPRSLPPLLWDYCVASAPRLPASSLARTA